MSKAERSGELVTQTMKVTRRTLAAVFATIVLLGVGYLIGRTHPVGRLLRQLRDHSQQRSASYLVDQQIAPGAAKERYRELNELLDEQLKGRLAGASRWEGLLETTTQGEREEIVEATRTELISLLHPWPGPRPDLAPRYGKGIRRPGLSGQLVEIPTHRGVKLTGALLEPEESEGPLPALLVLHGMYGGIDSLLDDIDYHHGLAAQLARAGFVVFAPLRVDTTIETRNTLYVKAFVSGWSLETVDLWQLVRAIDFLESLEEVAAMHIGVVGISLGGQHALWLGALDKRVSAVVSMAYFTNRFAWLFQRPDGDPSLPPGQGIGKRIRTYDNVLFFPSMGIALDDLNLVTLIQPRSLAFVVGTQDARHKTAKREFQKVKKLYQHLGKKERATFIDFEGGHEVSLDQVIPFLRRALG